MVLDLLPGGISAVCQMRNCDEQATIVFETIGHPNGDARAGYCGDHSIDRVGIWLESPKTYLCNLTGPFAPRVGA